jgi:peptidoglycan/LPS O-acetylase OafA/YrhL
MPGFGELAPSRIETLRRMPRRDNYYDYIRALAALLVLFAHKKAQMPGGAIGVSIFFCLSGFLIAQILIGLPSLTISNVAKFIFRRWMRIYPLYVFTIGVTFLLMQHYRPESLSDFASAIPGMLTFTRLPAQWTGFAATVGWTLHAEFWFYVFFPIIFMLTYKRGLLPLAIGFLIVASILSKIVAGHGEPDKWPTGNDQWYTVIYLDQMMYGAICAILIARHSSFVKLFTSKLWVWGGLVIILAMGKLLPFPTFDVYWYLQSSGAALLCAVAILHHEANPKTSKDNFIAWIGRISFSIYLVHAIVLDYVPTGELLPKLDTPLMVAIVLALSWLTEKYVERPGIRLSKWLAPFTSKSTTERLPEPKMVAPFP